jgi:hypothetical protein
MKIKRKEVLRQVAAGAEGLPVPGRSSPSSQKSVRGILNEMTGRGSDISGIVVRDGVIGGSDIPPSTRLKSRS